MEPTFPANQIAIGNPDGSGGLSSSPSLTYDPVAGDMEMLIGPSGAFNALDADEQNGFSSETGNTYILASGGAFIECGENGQELISVELGAIAIQSSDGSVSLLAPSGAVQLQSSPMQTVSFFGSKGSNRQTISGSLSDGTALKSLLTALASLGLIVDGTSA